MCPAQNLNVRLCGSLRKTDALMPELRAEGNRRTGTCRHPHSLSSRFGLPGTSRIADCFGLLGTGILRLLRASGHGASPIASGFSARGISDCFGLLGMGILRLLRASRHGAFPIALGFSARSIADCFGLLGMGLLRLLRTSRHGAFPIASKPEAQAEGNRVFDPRTVGPLVHISGEPISFPGVAAAGSQVFSGPAKKQSSESNTIAMEDNDSASATAGVHRETDATIDAAKLKSEFYLCGIQGNNPFASSVPSR
jgi:hypothetical protein